MNILDVNFEKYIPDIIDAYVEVFGEEYRNIITRKINNIVYVIYNDFNGINDYYEFLKNCKKKELSLKLLNQIGIDISNYPVNSYAEELDENILDLIEGYLGGTWSSYEENSFGIKAFQTVSENKYWQIEFLNFFRGNSFEPLTLETLEDFKKSEEYSKILDIINGYLKIYDNLVLEYKQYLKTIEEYNNYIKSETERKQEIYNRKTVELYKAIENDIPSEIRKIIDEKTNDYKEKASILFNNNTVEMELSIESFSQESDEVMNVSSDEHEKRSIMLTRSLYFKSFGIDVDLYPYYKNYNELIQREDIQKLIPPKELIEKIIIIKEEKKEEALKEFICNSATFIKNIKTFEDNPSNNETLYLYMKNEMACVLEGRNGFKEFVPILLFAIRVGDVGTVDYVFLYEFEHIISADYEVEKGYRCGLRYHDEELNPYNPKKGKYERMNETFADIFAIEARNILHKKGIYFADLKEHIIDDVKDRNTHSLLKELLYPLLKEYRTEIIEARILGTLYGLVNLIGEENYEVINDIVNRVDYLLEQPLYNKLEKNEVDDPLVIEYNLQMKRLEQIYMDIGVIDVENSKSYVNEKRNHPYRY